MLWQYRTQYGIGYDQELLDKVVFFPSFQLDVRSFQRVKFLRSNWATW